MLGSQNQSDRGPEAISLVRVERSRAGQFQAGGRSVLSRLVRKPSLTDGELRQKPQLRKRGETYGNPEPEHHYQQEEEKNHVSLYE